MEDVASCTSSSENSEMSRCALIGKPTGPTDPAEAAGCSSGKEVVVYSKLPTLPAQDSCRAVVPVESDSALQPCVVVEFSWDADWAWSVLLLIAHQHAELCIIHSTVCI